MADCYGGADGTKEQKKTFKFSDSRTGETLCVVIPEVIDPAYGMYVWPCAPVLAQYIWFHRQHLTTKRILELGAGTALPGVVAAKCGAQVTLSDNALSTQCLRNYFEDIIVTVSFLLEKNLGSQFWCTYQQRSSDWSIAHLLENWKLTCEHVPLTCFAAETPHLAGSNLPGDHTIHLLIIKKVNNRVTKSFT
ncbi:histone-arginine methyltransferase METTL23-like isoform X3 [Liolophura sinensis]|uniref:histone-arginine methyltransferase METTL23-like isoform X3 n=1 Tax=Liolophura sinensis TaxID=3198878 RepID=UPI003159750A